MQHPLLNFNCYDSVVETPDYLQSIGIEQFLKQKWVDGALEEAWIRNYEENKPHIVRTPQLDMRGKVAVLVGASPAIHRNYSALKGLGEDFVIVACSTILQFLLKEGIRPRYVMAVDFKEEVAAHFDCDQEGITLIASPFLSPRAVAAWHEEKFFYIVGGGSIYEKRMLQDFAELDICGGNVTNTSLLWAYKYLNIRDFILCGMSLCAYEDYYFDKRTISNEEMQRYKDSLKAVDIYGNVVSTTPALVLYKVWLEMFSKHMLEFGGSLINSTEDGIFGVLPEPVAMEGNKVQYKIKYLPWIGIAPLKLAIQAHTDKRRANVSGD